LKFSGCLPRLQGSGCRNASAREIEAPDAWPAPVFDPGAGLSSGIHNFSKIKLYKNFIFNNINNIIKVN
jgi:hypothetical protein